MRLGGRGCIPVGTGVGLWLRELGGSTLRASGTFELDPPVLSGGLIRIRYVNLVALPSNDIYGIGGWKLLNHRLLCGAV
jgi:hypothetical protein